MSYQDRVFAETQEISAKLEEVEEILLGLPVRPGQKRIIQKMITDLQEEIESACELSAVDYE
jgi:hypothetical protein